MAPAGAVRFDRYRYGVYAVSSVDKKLNAFRCCMTNSSVNFRSVARFAVSLLAISAWLAASNHCAIGATAPSQVAKAPAHAGCPGHNSPEKGGKSGEMECCKSFPPASVDAGKTLVSYDANQFALQIYFVTSLLSPENSGRDLRPLELDTGPPRAPSFVDTGPPGENSFAELVLQRSILAHAPPFVA